MLHREIGLWADFPVNALLHEKVSHFRRDANARESPSINHKTFH